MLREISSTHKKRTTQKEGKSYCEIRSTHQLKQLIRDHIKGIDTRKRDIFLVTNRLACYRRLSTGRFWWSRQQVQRNPELRDLRLKISASNAGARDTGKMRSKFNCF